MYGPEVGAQTMAYMNRPAAGQKRFLRSTDKETKREYEKKNLADFRDIFKKNKLGWYKHILRLNKDRRPVRF
jgi:hypothetical protein